VNLWEGQAESIDAELRKVRYVVASPQSDGRWRVTCLNGRQSFDVDGDSLVDALAQAAQVVGFESYVDEPAASPYRMTHGSPIATSPAPSSPHVRAGTDAPSKEAPCKKTENETATQGQAPEEARRSSTSSRTSLGRSGSTSG
jgi:hypothetical protein